MVLISTVGHKGLMLKKLYVNEWMYFYLWMWRYVVNNLFNLNIFLSSSLPMSLKTSLDLGIKDLCREFAEQATTHGLRRIAETKTTFGKLFWTFVFLSALAGCFYHCSFLIQKYLKFSKVTTTEEIHAKQLEFPALTVCNMNILKNAFFTEQLSVNENTTHERKRGMYTLFSTCGPLLLSS